MAGEKGAPGGIPRAWRWLAAAVAVAVGVTGVVIVVRSGGAEPLPAAPSPAPEEPVRHPLEVRLLTRGLAVTGKARRRELARAGQGIRRTLAAVYTTGFVDPRAWRGGRFPGLSEHFSGGARREVRRDVAAVSLGRAAARLSEVRPRPAVLRARVAFDARRRPVAALASMDFRGTGIGRGGEERPIRHRGRYFLRRAEGRWRIVAFQVRRRVVPEGVPGVPTRGSLFILALGSDARPGEAVARARADSIHVIGVNVRQRKASILGIPRDSYVPIPGVGTRKINEALFHGGPGLATRTVERLLGVRMHAYLLTGFEDFRRLVSYVGGVKVRIPYRMSDAASGAFFRPGRKRLRGPEALAFSRNRHDAPGGDFGRSLNQGRLILAALGELRSDFRRDPLTLVRWLVGGARYVQTDLSAGEMLELLIGALSIEPRRVRNAVVSGSGGSAGGGSIVRLGSGAGATFRDLARDGVLGGRR